MIRRSQAGHQTRRLAAALLFALFIFGGSITVLSDAQELEVERWRTPMRVDRETVATDLIVEFAFERLETQLVDYEPGENSDNVIMSEFALALAGGNVDGALALTADVPGASREQSRPLLEAFSEMFASVPEAVRLERSIHMGRERLLIWSLPMENGQRFYRSFRFMRQDRSDDSPIEYEGVLSEPLSSLLTYAFQIQQDAGPDSREADAFEYDYVVPATEEQPVRFLFNGQTIDVDAFNPGGETGIPAVDAYTRAMATLANEGAEDYAALFTDFSQGRYVNWANEQGPEAYEAFREDMLQLGGRIVFVMEADPLYLVYHTPTDTAVTGSPLRYTSLYRDPENGFRLSNFYVHGLADTFLQRREYFEEPFLRPLLAGANILERPSNTIGVVASQGESEPPDPDQMLASWAPSMVDKNEEPPSDIETLAKDDTPWLWIVIGTLLIALLAYRLLAKRL